MMFCGIIFMRLLKNKKAGIKYPDFNKMISLCINILTRNSPLLGSSR